MKARLPQGRGGGPTNMQGIMKQAQKMQEDMATLQEELDARVYDISAGGGAVKVKINGKKYGFDERGVMTYEWTLATDDTAVNAASANNWRC